MASTIIMPQLGETVAEGKILAWFKAVGDHVDEGQTVGHLDGPGTSTPVCSPFRGQLVGMLVHRGERLREGQPVAWLRVA